MDQQILQRRSGFVFSANTESLAAFALRGLLALITKHDEPSCLDFDFKMSIEGLAKGNSDLSHSAGSNSDGGFPLRQALPDAERIRQCRPDAQLF
jgi:hypothetical protein